MKSWIIILNLIGIIYVSGGPVIKIIQAHYRDPADGQLITMDVHVNNMTQTVKFHMPSSETFVESDTLEDYNSGFAATVTTVDDNDDTEGCFIRGLDKSFDESIKEFEEVLVAHDRVMPFEGDENVDVMEIEEDDEALVMIGDKIKEFCGDRQLYKMGTFDENEDEDEDSWDNIRASAELRQQTITFRRCRFFFFFFKCITTTITVPTGTNIIFLWFFG